MRPRAISEAKTAARPGRAGRVPLLLVAALAAWPAQDAHAARVAGVTPQGEVGVVRQVAVRFDASVVNAGDPRVPAPFKLSCNGATPAGSGYWLDDRRWVYDLAEALPAGQRCTLRAEATFRPGGAALEGPAEYAFSTGAPAVVSLWPTPGTRVEEDQHFLLQLTGPVDAASVARQAWCEAEGVGERIPLRVAEPALRDQVLRRQGRFAGGGRGGRAAASEAAFAARHVLLACQRLFAPDGRVRLVWGAGIAGVTLAGQAPLVTREKQQWQWPVRPRFAAEFSCERESAGAPCLPLRPLTLRFNAPVPREVAAAARLVPAATVGAAPATPAAAPAPIAPRLDDEDRRAATITEVRFAAPLPENTRFQITLPADLKDDAGRPLANAASFPLAVATGGLPPLAKFAGAPFGIVEAPAQARSGDKDAAVALLPLTLRHVQADLAGLATTGQVAIKRLSPELTDAALLAWIGRVQRWHERDLPAKEAGLPPSQWSETVSESETMADGRVRTRTVKRDKHVPSRELSIFVGETDVRRAELPQLKDTQPRATEVLGVPLRERGYHVVEVSSRILGESLLAKKEPMFARTGVLVTNLAVHFKKGRSSSLVWVTSLDRGRPVAGARVSVNDCNGLPLWGGQTDARGIARIERGFDESQNGDGSEGRCLTGDGFFVTARTAPTADRGGDLGFVFSRWVRGIEPWRFNTSLASGTAPDRRAHTVFDRELLKRGETVSMKHFVRDETEHGLAYTAPEHLPDTVVITHVGSGQEATLPLAWTGQPARSALSRWAVPKNAALGLYDVALKRGDRSLQSGSFRVEDFRVPLVDARLAIPAAAGGTRSPGGAGRGVLIAPADVEFQAQVNAMAGGPMPGLALALSALLRDTEPRFAGHEDFAFGLAERSRDEEEAGVTADGSDSGDGSGTRTVARQLPARTDLQGAARIHVPGLPALRGPAELVAEMSFADPNGETQTVSRRLLLWPAAVVVGLRAPDWAAQRGAARFTAAVLDTEGRPLAGRAVEVIGRAHQTLSTRKRIVGGFYSYDNQRRTIELGVLCSGKTDAQGRLNCDARVEHTGEVELVANAKDEAGRTSRAATRVWVTSERDEDRLWFAQGNDDRIDVLPEKRELEPGQTARLQVRMPFQQATALVTVEREGVIDARVLTLSGREPVIELPIPQVPQVPQVPDPGKGSGGDGASWAPNVTVAVFVQRGRLREAPWWSLFTWGWREPGEWWRAFRYEGKEWRAPSATVDLAKPSFKFGVAQLRIGNAAHRLDVKVSTPQAQYRVREKVSTTVRVSFQGRPLAGADVAFAAVDEGLLALAENRSWDLLGGLFKERPWGVETSTAVNEVIGRRHYGRKALPPGGGGGRNPTRELFDTLLLWRGSVQLDANGEARIEVPLNDSLTSFRLVAMADAGADRFGQGHAVVRVSQDLQMLPGLPPLVREGDRFEAGFTVRNGATRPMQVRATLVGSAVGGGGGGGGGGGTAVALSFAPQSVQLAPGAAAELRWPVDVPAGTERIDWSAGATEEGSGSSGGPARDNLKLSQAVAPTVPVRVLQATLQPLQGNVSLPVAAPADSLPGRGGLQVALQPRLSGALPGLKRYFETYPYSCLEQKVSRTLALGDEAAWKVLRDEVAGYLDGEGLASYFPPGPGSAARGSDRLTAYLLSAAHEAGASLPDGTRNAMLDGLAAFVEGRLERRFPAPRPDLEVRKLAALEALARHGRADARWWGSIAFAPAAWPTSALLDAWGALQRSPGAPDRDARLAEVQRLVKSRLTEGGTTLRFTTEADDDQWWWLMESADANAARLLLAAMSLSNTVPAWKDWKDDVPRLVNGALARQKGGAWRTTTANLWGVLALQRFGKVFESEGVGGRSVIELGPSARTVDWGGTTGGQGATLLLPWPPSPGSSASPPATLAARHEGTGRPWLTVQSLAAVPLKAPLAAGYRVTRSVSAVQRRVPEAWSRGDIMRVRLEIDAQADMSWVVVSDPLPAGAAHLGTGLARDSAIATQGERREGVGSGAGWPAYEERAHDAWRAYYAWLPRGRHIVEYTIRLNSAGRFGLPPARVEAMYAPESFGELPLAALEVRP
ncbi:MAG: alpha-2-macroglobulin [Burkholderiales bacterium]|nr:alpha-2-macroglobulin [Burkholderiales bacterium]